MLAFTIPRGTLLHCLPLSLLLILFLLPRVIHGDLSTELCKGEPEQLIKRPDCVCWSRRLTEQYSELIRISPTMKDKASEVITMRLKYTFCHQYLQLPSHIEIEMSDGVPSPYSRRLRHKKRLYADRRHRKLKRIKRSSYHHRSKRQISLGFPTPSKWEEIIPHLPKHGRHYYAPVGSLVVLKCLQGHDSDTAMGIQDRVDDLYRSFEWRHSNGMEITASLVTNDFTTGDLTFNAVRLADTGIYNCSVYTGGNDNDPNGKTTDRKEIAIYQSQLDVVAGPTYWLRFGITYQTGRCRHKELLEIQHNVPNLVHKYACHFCSVVNVSMTCINFGDGGGKEAKIVQLTLAMSALGFEDYLTGWEHNYVHCNLECQKSIHAKILEITGQSLVKLFSLQIHVLPVEGETSVYTSIPDSYDEDLADGCPPGFFLQYSLCFPCAPGKYSPTGPADCFACAKGFFQPNPGSSSCFHCPKEHTTLKTGSRSQMDCILDTASWWMTFIGGNVLLAVIILCAILFLIFLLLLICCCWPNSRLGRWIRCVPCCGEEGCCGGSGEEQEISEDKQALLSGSGREFDSEGLSSEDESSRGRRMKYAAVESSDDDGPYGNEFSTSKKEFTETEQEQETNQNENSSEQNVTLTVVREKKRKSVMPKPNHLDLTKCPVKRPICSYRVRRGYCENTMRNLRRQQRELEVQERLLIDSSTDDQDARANLKTPPAFPRSREGEDGNATSESSETKRFMIKNPHLKLGNILSKSKSLMSKLAEQRRKLRHISRPGSESSQKTKKVKSDSSLASKAQAFKTKLKNKMVKISESGNTYHPSCKTCSSDVFKNDGGGEETGSWRKKVLNRSNSALKQFRNRSRERIKSTVANIESKLKGKRSGNR